MMLHHGNWRFMVYDPPHCGRGDLVAQVAIGRGKWMDHSTASLRLPAGSVELTYDRADTATLTLDVCFATPAFLGNGDQIAQWRPQPFKALIRQWWRIVHAGSVCFDDKILLVDENDLFGHASEGKSRASRVRIRVNPAGGAEGTWTSWGDFKPGPELKVPHPEAGQNGQPRDVGAELYLGYGPLTYDKATKTTGLSNRTPNEKTRTAISPHESGTLDLRLPGARRTEIMEALQLAAWFGTMGSRSRNGWGSVHLIGEGLAPRPQLSLVERLALDLEECLKCDWPHAFGKDDRGLLIWRLRPSTSWRGAMQRIAELKIAFRTALAFEDDKTRSRLQRRHLLAYPVTHHELTKWQGDSRLPNQLRFKILREGDNLTPLAYHLPAGLPANLRDKLDPSDRQALPQFQREVWRSVHAVIDRNLPGGRLGQEERP